jgi:hypothetical protein
VALEGIERQRGKKRRGRDVDQNGVQRNPKSKPEVRFYLSSSLSRML